MIKNKVQEFPTKVQIRLYATSSKKYIQIK